MPRLLFRVLLVILLGAWASGCALLHLGGRRRGPSEAELARARREPLPIGRVSLVNVEDRFALIEATLVQSPPPGTVLRAYTGDAVSAELRATGVRRRPFMVADLVSGIPAKGDLVVQPAKDETAAVPTVAVKPAAAPGDAEAKQPRWKRWLGFFRGRQ